MKLAPRISILISLLFAGICATAFAAPDPPPCSTEKVNHEDCILTINRWYPVTFPTIQMSQGKQIIVKLENQLPFESVTLDSTGTTLLPASDQGAALLTAAIPNLKGLVFSTAIKPGAAPGLPGKPAIVPKPGASPAENQVIPELAQLQQMLQDASGTIDFAFTHALVVYAQLSQALSPLPVPGTSSAAQVPPLPADPSTPNPWRPASYPFWRAYLLCELVGGSDCATANPPSFNNVLGQLSGLQSGLPPATSNLLFDQHVFDFLAQKASNDIQSIPAGSRQPYLDKMTLYTAQENRLVSVIASLGTSLPAVQKDFQTYYENINLTLTNPVPDSLDKDGKLILGSITDPRSSTVSYPHYLGKQITFSVNVINQIATSRASVINSQAKTAIATITVLYADPRFETSAGVLFNFVHNRTFADQTITTSAPGTAQTAGEMQIFETATRPTVVPFVAGHIRLGDDFTIPALGRRAAFYATAWVGINPNNTLPEYGAGPTFAWRSLMFSVLYDRTHDTRLAPGSYVGQIVCSPSPPTGSSLPSCTPAPAAPTSTTFATNAFAFGLSVRIPTSFAPGAGGISR
jgi:hypothetical protein